MVIIWFWGTPIWRHAPRPEVSFLETVVGVSVLHIKFFHSNNFICRQLFPMFGKNCWDSSQRSDHISYPPKGVAPATTLKSQYLKLLSYYSSTLDLKKKTFVPSNLWVFDGWSTKIVWETTVTHWISILLAAPLSFFWPMEGYWAPDFWRVAVVNSRGLARAPFGIPKFCDKHIRKQNLDFESQKL